MPFVDNTYVPCWNMSEQDVWNFDQTLATFIADGLELLAEITHSIPAGVIGAGLIIHSVADNGDKLDEWKNTLKEKATEFRKYAEDDMWDIQPTMIWFVKHWRDLWD